MNLAEIVALDEKLSQQVVGQLNGRYLRAIAWIIARTGDSWFWLVAIALLIQQKESLGWKLLATVIVTAVLVFICKWIVKRERPEESSLAISADKYAFPSGHASRAGAVTITLAFALPHLTIVWLLWSIMVSAARVALSRHFLMDVMGGLLLGFIVGFFMQIFI